MAVFTYELATEYSFPNILLYKTLRDGVHVAWKVYPADGYVMYDSTAENYELQQDPETGELVQDPETGEFIEVPVTYYFVDVDLPLNYPFDSFPWVAVPRDSVDENYIFGLPDEEHEKI